jgi:hypothetical protein
MIYQQFQSTSVDKNFSAIVVDTHKSQRASAGWLMSSKKSSFYLYDYAKILTPLHVVDKKNLHTMPKRVAICTFPSQTLENRAWAGRNYQVMHSFCGRKKSLQNLSWSAFCQGQPCGHFPTIGGPRSHSLPSELTQSSSPS